MPQSVMDEREFIGQRQATWRRLSLIVEKAWTRGGIKDLSRDEVRELGPLYRRVATDLAYARSHDANPDIIATLNFLVGRSYSLLYQTDRKKWSGLLTFFTHDFPQTFRRRINAFAAAVLFMVFGALAGYWLVAQARDNIYLFLPPGSTLHDSIAYWESGDVNRNIGDAEGAVQASFLMQNNIKVSFVAFALGAVAGIGTFYVLFLNGAILGAMAALMTRVGQHGNFWPSILPHGVVELSETALAGAAGLAIGWAMLAPGVYRRRDALVLAAQDAVKLLIGGVFLLIFAGLVEAFLSHSLLPKPFKVTFGIVSGIALYAYLFLAGRGTNLAEEPVNL